MLTAEKKPSKSVPLDSGHRPGSPPSLWSGCSWTERWRKKVDNLDESMEQVHLGDYYSLNSWKLFLKMHGDYLNKTHLIKTLFPFIYPSFVSSSLLWAYFGNSDSLLQPS